MQTKIPTAPQREQITFYYKGKWVMIYEEKKGCFLWNIMEQINTMWEKNTELLLLYLVEHVDTTRLQMVNMVK